MSTVSDPRTDDEILARIDFIKSRDLFGFESSDLVTCLDFQTAKREFAVNAEESAWEIVSREPVDVIARMHDYMPFAWDHANNRRGLSAGRSMSHYSAWTWLAGDNLGDLLDYRFYGKDKLVLICNYYGWDSSEWDDGVRSL